MVADINYANTNGGTFTINLQPNTTFVGGLPVIGGTKTVNLTIHGNGSSDQDATRVFQVAPGSSLTLDHMTLQNGYEYAFNGGAIYNWGMLVISNCTLSGNVSYYSGYISSLLGGEGGAIYNNAGTVIISDSFLSGNSATGNGLAFGGAIYNDHGTVTIIHSTISDNGAFGDGGGIYNDSGTVTISHSTISGNSATSNDDFDWAHGGGIYNNGTVTVENSSSITGNDAYDLGPDVYNLGQLYLDDTSTIGVLNGNSAIGLNPALSINSRSSTAHQLVLSWSTNYTGCTLQSSTNLGSTNWTDCASPTVSAIPSSSPIRCPPARNSSGSSDETRRAGRAI